MKDKMSPEEFNKLSTEEQDKLIQELRDELGGNKIDMKLWVKEDVAKWWAEKVASDYAGSTSIELLMSKFFTSLLYCSLKTDKQEFMERTAIAIQILLGIVVFKWKDPPCDGSCDLDDDYTIGGGDISGGITYN